MKLSEQIRQACLDLISRTKDIDFEWIARNTHYSDWYYQAQMLERKVAKLEKKLDNIRKIAREEKDV